MARYQFEQDAAGDELLSRGTRIAQGVVQGCGFVLLAVGLWIALAVIAEAWSLYQDPARVERVADAIERGSHLDRTLAAAGGATPMTDEEAAESPAAPAPGSPGPNTFRLSYFVAWIITLLLLMLVGRLAIAAVKTGGELVLYDRQFKRLARELVRELKSS